MFILCLHVCKPLPYSLAGCLIAYLCMASLVDGATGHISQILSVIIVVLFVNWNDILIIPISNWDPIGFHSKLEKLICLIEKCTRGYSISNLEVDSNWIPIEFQFQIGMIKTSFQ